MRIVDLKRSVIALAMGLLIVSCSGGTQLKFDVNKANETFRIVDAKSGNQLSYNKIIIEGKEVVGTSYFMEMCIFYFENKENTGFRYDLKMKYQLENGVLAILKE